MNFRGVFVRKYYVFQVTRIRSSITDPRLPLFFIIFNNLLDAQAYANQEDLLIEPEKKDTVNLFPVKNQTKQFRYPHVFFKKESDYEQYGRHKNIRLIKYKGEEIKVKLEDCYEALFYNNLGLVPKTGIVIPKTSARYTEEEIAPPSGHIEEKNYKNFDFNHIFLKPVIIQTRYIPPSALLYKGPCSPPPAPIQPIYPSRYQALLSADCKPELFAKNLINLFEDYYRPYRTYYLGEFFSRFFTAHLGRHRENIKLAKQLVTELREEKISNEIIIQKLWDFRAKAFHNNPHALGSGNDLHHPIPGQVEEFNQKGSFVRRLNYALTTGFSIITKENKKDYIELDENPEVFKPVITKRKTKFGIILQTKTSTEVASCFSEQQYNKKVSL